MSPAVHERRIPGIALVVILLGAAPAAGAVPAAAADSSAAPADSASSADAGTDSLPLRLEPAATLVAGGEGATRGIEPSGVAVDAFGRPVVADAGRHRVLRYDENGRYLGESGALGSESGLMRRPGAVAILGTLSVGVLDAENRRVLSYDLFGKFQGVLVDLQSSDLADRLGRVAPIAIAADRGGALAVADGEQDRLILFDFSGRLLRVVGGFGARPGSFRGLRGVAFTRRGELVTAERGGARVQRLDAAGRVLASWALPVSPSAALLPVAVDDSGRVAIADEGRGTLWLFDSGGRTLARRTGLAGPRALGFDRDGSLLVAEAAAGRVRRWRLEAVDAPPGRAPE